MLKNNATITNPITTAEITMCPPANVYVTGSNLDATVRYSD